jgi:hypothetical protein
MFMPKWATIILVITAVALLGYATYVIQKKQSQPVNDNLTEEETYALETRAENPAPQTNETDNPSPGRRPSSEAPSNIVDNTYSKPVSQLLTSDQPDDAKERIGTLKGTEYQPEAISALIDAIRDADEFTRPRYFVMLSLFEDESIIPLLDEFTNSEEPGTKFMALSTIAMLGTEKSVQTLPEKSSESTDEQDKLFYTQILAKTPPPKIIPHLISTLSSENETISSEANYFLEKFSKQTYDFNPENKESAAKHWNDWWKNWKIENNIY